VWVRSQYLFSWDSVNFALALDHWDLSLHQPHPPGYLGYVLLARVLGCYTTDPNAALILVVMAATAAAGAVLCRLAKYVGVPPIQCWVGLLVFLSSPLIWLYSSVAEVYALEMLCALLIAAACLRARRGESALVALSLAYAACAIVKLPTAILMLPLALSSGKGRRLVSIVVSAGTVVVIVGTMVLWDPSIPSLFWQQFLAGTGGSRLLGVSEPSLLRVLNRNARDTFQAYLMAGAALSLVLPYAAWRVVRSRVLDGMWAVTWALPSILTFVFIHLGKPGYLVPLVPLVCLYAMAGIGSLGRRGTIILGSIAFVNALQFLAVRPMTGTTSGEGLRYAEKTALQKFATDLNPIAFASRATITSEDERVDRMRRAVQGRCAETGVILVSSGGEIDWRRAMFYLPSHTVVRLDGGPIMMVAHDKRVTLHQPSVALHSECDVLWSTSEAAIATATEGHSLLVPERILGALVVAGQRQRR
jgi:hypothetical protein